MFHLGQLVLPVAGQLGLGQILDVEAAQQRHQLERLGGRHQFASVAVHVLLQQQALDDLGPRGRRAEPLLGHGLAKFVVIDQLAGAFHRRQQRGLGVARRRLGLQGVGVDALGAHHFARLHRDQVGVVLLRLLAVHRQPAGLDQHLAVGLERVLLGTDLDGRDARRDHRFGAGEEHRQEALDDQVVQLGFDLAQALRCLQRGDDGEVVGYLGVVEDALDRLDVAFLERGLGVDRQRAQRSRQVFLAEHRHGVLDHLEVVLGQGARIGARVGQHLVLFVQRLRQRQRGLGRKAEARIGLALQGRQVVQQRAGLAARLGLFGHAGRLAAAGLRQSAWASRSFQIRSARRSASSSFLNFGSNHLPS